MAFRVPTMNLFCGIWHQPAVLTNPPDVVSRCNLKWMGRGPSEEISSNSADWQNCMILCLPAHTDVRDASSTTNKDYLEVPLGSGRFYYCPHFDDVAKGFANEYRFALIAKLGTWPTPAP